MSESRKIRILIVDDYPLLRKGIAALIESHPDLHLIGQASNSSEAIQQVRQRQPDVILMDLQLPDMSGIEAIVTIRAEFPNARVIVLSTSARDAEIQKSLEAGACGYLLKTAAPDDLIESIRQVHAGGKSISPEIASRLAEHLGNGKLSDRQLEVLRLVALGSRNRGIPLALSISEFTVKVHVQHILEKLQAN